ncbi:unnamed protein product, partial [Brugia timori]|uniref:Transposase n=1 Tax=Brugia timori TaxID=42155 RepID=A0A0R3QJ21_9BILA
MRGSHQSPRATAVPRCERFSDARARGRVRTKSLRKPDLGADWNVSLRRARQDAGPARLDKWRREKRTLD